MVLGPYAVHSIVRECLPTDGGASLSSEQRNLLQALLAVDGVNDQSLSSLTSLPIARLAERRWFAVDGRLTWFLSGVAPGLRLKQLAGASGIANSCQIISEAATFASQIIHSRNQKRDPINALTDTLMPAAAGNLPAVQLGHTIYNEWIALQLHPGTATKRRRGADSAECYSSNKNDSRRDGARQPALVMAASPLQVGEVLQAPGDWSRVFNNPRYNDRFAVCSSHYRRCGLPAAWYLQGRTALSPCNCSPSSNKHHAITSINKHH
jgi:hypothetical protein